MKVKRQRQTRKHLRFLRTAYGFREPFKVVCDGNFLHHVVSLKLTAVSSSLPKLLNSPAKVYTTRCVVAELRKLGEEFKETTFQARKLGTYRCEHETPVAASECLLHAVSAGNPQHLFIATQDSALQRTLLCQPGTALIRARGTALVLEGPSEAQVAGAVHSQQQTQGMPRHERDALEKQGLAGGRGGRGGRLVVGPTGLLEKTEDEGTAEKAGEKDKGVEEKVTWRRGYASGLAGNDDGNGESPRQKRKVNHLSLKDGPRFKRNKAKGPNPLSCKKKKAKADESQAAAASGEKKRKRRRGRPASGVEDSSHTPLP